jgi:hypothetical protein
MDAQKRPPLERSPIYRYGHEWGGVLINPASLNVNEDELIAEMNEQVKTAALHRRLHGRRRERDFAIDRLD